jgi:hypothetical protein
MKKKVISIPIDVSLDRLSFDGKSKKKGEAVNTTTTPKQDSVPAAARAKPKKIKSEVTKQAPPTKNTEQQSQAEASQVD